MAVETNKVDRLYNSEEVGEILQLNPKVVERKARRKQIPGFKLGKYYRCSPAALQEWIEAQSNPVLPSTSQACRIQPSF